MSGPAARAAMGSAGGFAAASGAAAAFAFGLGANDVANSFGTSVGSGAVSLRQAVFIAVVCEVAGAVGLGRGVSNTLTEKISYLRRDDCWDCDAPDGGRVGVFALGMACALAAGGLFLLLATLKGLPVSTTHTIVGGVLGITVLGTSGKCVLWGWPGLLKIVASWFISPAASGLASCLVLWGIKRGILGSPQPFQSALFALPFLFGGTLAVLAMLVLESESPWEFWVDALAALGAGASSACLARVFAVPMFRARVERQVEGGNGAIELGAVAKPHTRGGAGDDDGGSSELDDVSGSDAGGGGVVEGGGGANSSDTDSEKALLLNDGGEDSECAAEAGMGAVGGEAQKAENLFKYLQVFTACLKSFAHGANDTANAAGPYAVVEEFYFRHGVEGEDMCSISTPLWVLAFTGLGIALGLAILGNRVIETVGKKIADINFTRGFAIELGSTLAVLFASFFGAPISSTHCQIGSVLMIGVMESGVRSVDWGSLSKIVVAWFVTVPFAALVSAAFLAATNAILQAAHVGS